MDRRRRRPLCVCDSTLEPISRGESAQVARRRLRFHAFFLLGSRLLVSACHLVSFSLSLFLFLSLSPSIPLLHSDSISLHRMSSFVYFKFSLSPRSRRLVEFARSIRPSDQTLKLKLRPQLKRILKTSESGIRDSSTLMAKDSESVTT